MKGRNLAAGRAGLVAAVVALSAAATAGTPAAAAGAGSTGHRCKPHTAYVANSYSGTVTPINTSTNTAGPPIPADPGSDAIAITPDGQTAYAANNWGTVTRADDPVTDDQRIG